MDASFWDAEDGVLRGWLTRQAGVDSSQLEAFFKRWWLTPPDQRDLGVELVQMGLDGPTACRHAASWAALPVRPEIVRTELMGQPEPLASFCWGLVVDGDVSAEDALAALEGAIQAAANGRKLSIAQLLIAGGGLAPERFLERLASAGQAILECADCKARNWVTEYHAEHTFICESCCGELARPKGAPDADLARMAGYDSVLGETTRHEDWGPQLHADPSGSLHVDPADPGRLVKHLNLGGDEERPTRVVFRKALHTLRNLRDPRLLVPTRTDIGDDETLEFETQAGHMLDRTEDRSPNQIARVILSLARAVAAMHRVGLYHGALRPGSVWVPDSGNPPVQVIASAEWCQPRATADWPGPLAPAASPSAADDVRRLGQIWVWMATGKYVSGSPSRAQLADLGETLAGCAADCLAQPPRFMNAGELSVAIQRLVGDPRESSRHRVSGTRRLQRERQQARRRNWAIAICLALAAIIGLILLLSGRSRRSTSRGGGERIPLPGSMSPSR